MTPENLSSNEMYSTICNTIEDLFSFTLRLLGENEILRGDDFLPSELENKKAFSEENSIDNILYGEVTTEEDGTILISMYLYEKSSDSVVAVSAGKSPSVFDVFDVSDAILVELMKEFSDIHIGFGSLNFLNIGETGKYEVYLDGILLGEDLTSVDKILNKDYQVEIRQTRLAEESVIHTERLTIREGEITELSFSVPYLTTLEQSNLASAKASARESMSTKNLLLEQSEIQDLTNMILRMNDLSFCPSLYREKQVLEKMMLLWQQAASYRNAIAEFNRGIYKTTDEYMIHISKDYQNMLELSSLLSLSMSVKAWERKDWNLGWSYYKEAVKPKAGLGSNFLTHMKEESEYINSLFYAYYKNESSRNARRLKKKLRDHYGELWGPLEQAGIDLPLSLDSVESMKKSLIDTDIVY
ncbi:hypothetical protein [Oceanispirochaeta sp.]|uniref:hypothetical protein n=1 Tax=Oceanispirochaeta sp. TaxID=2035350 RepID=UPI0026073BE7|nr:hypothetical protein [Oceanispirochaeta sp.]MDA3958701.1 hypothetical protein [Oceanispirochaeta sp.]